MADAQNGEKIMTEYIEREAATQAAVKEVWLGQTSTGRIAKAINDVPAADVIKVVRCEECNFFNYAHIGNGFCVNEDGLQNPYPKDFCSHAERRVTNGLK